MEYRLARLRFRRRFRKSQRQLEDIGQQAEEQIEEHLFRRFNRLVRVRRFVAAWLGLLVLLIGLVVAQNFLLSGYYQTLGPVPGGIYNEGVLGTFTNANPLYATSDVDSTVSHLLFAGLFKYNDRNKLVGDLALGYAVSPKGTDYTVHLRPNVTWHDGKPLTASDVVFTYRLIQNPDAQSPLLASWQGITITATDAQTIVFKLPTALASFPYNLTNGIVPQHLLRSVSATELRSADFNTIRPIGSGPFMWQAIQVSGSEPANAQEQITLVPNHNYYGGSPKLDQFIIHAYADKTQLAAAFSKNRLNGVEGLETVPKTTSASRVHNLQLTAATMVFFKTTDGPLADGRVRSALVSSADRSAIVSQLGYATHEVDEPLLNGQLGYDKRYKQPGYNLNQAANQLEISGWLKGTNGLRTKDGKTLHFNLISADTPEYHQVVRGLQSSWAKLGVQVHAQFLDPADFQNSLSSHDYDAVLYGISIGVDPDVFVYWDSSQADIRSANRLNLSEYKSAVADASLEAGRTRLDPTLRVVKYRAFLQAWQADNPALGLYQPRVLYITNGVVAGFNDHTLNTPTDRFSNVQNWEVREAKVTRP